MDHSKPDPDESEPDLSLDQSDESWSESDMDPLYDASDESWNESDMDPLCDESELVMFSDESIMDPDSVPAATEAAPMAKTPAVAAASMPFLLRKAPLLSWPSVSTEEPSLATRAATAAARLRITVLDIILEIEIGLETGSVGGWSCRSKR